MTDSRSPHIRLHRETSKNWRLLNYIPCVKQQIILADIYVQWLHSTEMPPEIILSQDLDFWDDVSTKCWRIISRCHVLVGALPVFVFIPEVISPGVDGQHQANEPEEGWVQSHESCASKQTSLGSRTRTYHNAVVIVATMNALKYRCP